MPSATTSVSLQRAKASKRPNTVNTTEVTSSRSERTQATCQQSRATTHVHLIPLLWAMALSSGSRAAWRWLGLFQIPASEVGHGKPCAISTRCCSVCAWVKTRKVFSTGIDPVGSGWTCDPASCMVGDSMDSPPGTAFVIFTTICAPTRLCTSPTESAQTASSPPNLQSPIATSPPERLRV